MNTHIKTLGVLVYNYAIVNTHIETLGVFKRNIRSINIQGLSKKFVDVLENI